MRGGNVQCVGLANFHSVNTFITTDFKLLMKIPEHVTTEKCMSAIKNVPGTHGLMFLYPAGLPCSLVPLVPTSHTPLCCSLSSLIQMV